MIVSSLVIVLATVTFHFLIYFSIEIIDFSRFLTPSCLGGKQTWLLSNLRKNRMENRTWLFDSSLLIEIFVVLLGLQLLKIFKVSNRYFGIIVLPDFSARYSIA